MGPWSDTADARHDAGQLLYRPALAELLKAAKLRYLEIGILNIAVVIEKNLYLAVSLKPGNGVNTNLFSFCTLPSALLKAFSLQHGIGQPESVKSARRVNHFLHHPVNLFVSVTLINGGNGADQLGTLVNNPGGGPKQPRQGILALIHLMPQPPRVAGPQQIIPCSRRHFLGSGIISWGR